MRAGPSGSPVSARRFNPSGPAVGSNESGPRWDPRTAAARSAGTRPASEPPSRSPATARESAAAGLPHASPASSLARRAAFSASSARRVAASRSLRSSAQCDATFSHLTALVAASPLSRATTSVWCLAAVRSVLSCSTMMRRLSAAPFWSSLNLRACASASHSRVSSSLLRPHHSLRSVRSVSLSSARSASSIAILALPPRSSAACSSLAASHSALHLDWNVSRSADALAAACLDSARATSRPSMIPCCDAFISASASSSATRSLSSVAIACAALASSEDACAAPLASTSFSFAASIA